jgi:hypothetical protein
MAHECPECGQECYCDLDDMGGMPVPYDCSCSCKKEVVQPDCIGGGFCEECGNCV